MNFNKVQKRRGIGNVITTLIILIASVVLGAGVIFFGGSMFQTSTGSESIKVSNSHIWVGTTAGTGESVAAFVVQNTGDKVVSVERITIRGQSVPTSSWYYNNTASITTATNIQRELVWESNFDLTDGYNLDGAAGQEALTLATGPISLSQGQAAFIFLNDPATINAIDIGNNYTFQVLAGQATSTESVAVVSGS